MATLRRLERESRPASAEEQAVLARWSGWGAVPQVFDNARPEHAGVRAALAELLSPEQQQAAARATLNAHYTDAALATAMWRGVQALGFEAGAVLEPGCGSGTFIGLAPPGARMTGVELDPTTAAVAAALYPDATILNESFVETRVPEGSVDLVVGNVPFGDFKLTDRLHNPGGHSIHNHFILKSLHLTRPGGIVCLISSRYTLDARNPAARREMAALADLLGAVRLPSDAHQRAAGTSVVTDVLVFRRREPEREPSGVAWEQLAPVDVEGGVAEINEYFVSHPEAVLGRLHVGRGAYRAGELMVASEGETGPALERALAGVAERSRAVGLDLAPRADQARAARAVAATPARGQRPDGSLAVLPDGSFTIVEGSQAVPYSPKVTAQAEELRHLLQLRDLVVELLVAEAKSAQDSADLDGLRAGLNQRYDGYVRRYGALNRFAWRRTGRLDPASGQERMARIRPAQGGFRADPYCWTVYALEDFDPTTQKASKGAILRRRVVAPRVPRLGADTPSDALAICLDQHGEVRVEEIARLLGVDQAAARTALGGLVFTDPSASDRLIPAAQYLSGNVRRKLAEAREASQEDRTFTVNVRALEGVQPLELGPAQIEARLGASWIGQEDVRDFLVELLDDRSLVVEHPGGSVWMVRGSEWGVLATSTWGTARMPAPRIAHALLEQREVRVYDEVDGKRLLNLTETVAAGEKAAAMAERFAEWVWQDPVRAERLAQVYNERFNSVVLRSYDDATLSLPGMALAFQPRPHQVAAVARILQEPAVLLAHEVGAGKTATMVMGAWELRRLGLVNKPAVVVPNHMLEQFSREALAIYPQARVLAAGSEDLERDGRRQFIARCATGDWDIVILTRSAFERIPVAAETERAYVAAELAVIRRWVERSKAGRALSVKRLEKALLGAEERLRKKLETGKQDPGVSFELTGIDYLFVDEAHAYKNLRTPSNISGAAIDGAQRSADLAMKIDWLRRSKGQRVVTFATATPVSNSVAEVYVMQRYLQPEGLAGAGIEDFDTWAATFGETTSAVELAPDGNSFRLQTRFAKFRNVPELLRMFHVAADVKTEQDLKLPAPALVGGRAETQVLSASPELLAYVRELGERADRVRSHGIRPGEDNILSIATDGRLAALDLRLVGLPAPEQPGKIDAAADRIAAIWERHRDDRYLGPDGERDPLPGSLQMVFCDQGTPKPDQWNVYEELRTQLVRRGVARHMIRFVHEARDDRAKADLFNACRRGQVAVLIGSTERMGVGTNVQARAVALHHLDCPWRPADLHQREGRILRQGNQNPEVEIVRYVVEGSFDTFLWQTVERKARFIGQVMRGRLDVREIDDIGDTALSYAEVKALAAGDPRLMEKAQVDGDVARLTRLERAWAHNQDALRHRVLQSERLILDLTATVDQATAAIPQREDTRGDRFSMTIAGTRFNRRAEAGERLVSILRDESGLDRADPGRRLRIASLGGFDLLTTVRHGLRSAEVELAFAGVPASDLRLASEELGEIPPQGLISRLENRLIGLEHVRQEALGQIAKAHTERRRAMAELDRPFAQKEELEAAQRRAEELSKQLNELASPQPQPEEPESIQEPAPAHANGSRPLAGAADRLRALASRRPPEPDRGWELDR